MAIQKVYAVGIITITSIIFKVVCYGGAARSSSTFTQPSSIIAKAKKVAVRSIFTDSASVVCLLSVGRLTHYSRISKSREAGRNSVRNL